MRIVLDTNVLMSAIFFGGLPFRILDAWRAGKVQFAVCPEILAEYRQVAIRLNAKYKAVDVLPLLDLVAIHSHLVQVIPFPEPICDDPDDDVFFACALVARTRIVVSGDRHLLAASGRAGIQVLRPKTFVDQYL